MTHKNGTQHRRRHSIRLLETELEDIRNSALTAGLTVSEYMRRCALKKRVHSRVHLQVIGRLNQLGGLLKHLLMKIAGHPHEQALRDQLNSTLADVNSTLHEICKSARE